MQMLVRCTLFPAEAGAEAFTTCGKLIRSLRPQAKWRRSSFRPQDGMWVRQDVVQHRQLQPPQPARVAPGERCRSLAASH
jgi:hypothetical protein